MGEAFITRRGGGGSAGLNFEVVGGTAQPANPKENTIWVNTPQEITSYDFSAEMPVLRSNNKNKIVYPFYQTTKTEGGITWTDNSDGSITANGTAAADALFRVSAFDGAANHEYLEAGTYTLSGCPAGGSDSTYLMELFILNPVTLANEAIGRDYGEGFTFTLEHDCKARVNLNVMSGTTISGITFKPQIEKGSTATAFVNGDATGQVWIQTGSESHAEFNALKKNGLQVYPISAKQYVSGAWADKTAKTYQGGAWVDWVTYLYNKGNEYTDLTGGFTSVKATTQSGYTIGTMTKNSESIKLSCSAAQVVGAVTSKKIPIKGKNTIEINVLSITGGGTASLRVSNDNVLYGNMVATQDFSEPGIVSLAVETLDGEYYVGVRSVAGSGKTQTVEFDMLGMK